MPRRRPKPYTPRTLTVIERRNLLATANLANLCKHAAPCGAICVLDPDVRHTLHCCPDKECEACHGYNRFGRTYK